MELDIMNLIEKFGFAAIAVPLIYLLYSLLKTKDAELKSRNDEVIKVFKENAEVTAQIKDSLDNNTKAFERLTDNINQLLRK
jgi:uncharacterized membrane protein YdfJ with MMPL/SSD domain